MLLKCGSVLLMVLLMSVSAQAQSASVGLLRLWMSEEVAVEVSGHALFQSQGDSEGTAFDTRLSQFRSLGRARLDQPDLFTPSVGYSYYHIGIDSNDPLLPSNLQDMNVAVGFKHALDETWKVQLAVGAGYAGNGPFQDSEAIYGTADVMLTREFDDTTGITFGLDYNGARTLLPDLPIPIITYYNQSDPNFHYYLGVPLSSITWTPFEALTLRIRYELPINVALEARYTLADTLQIFGQLDSYTSRFWSSDSGVNQHLLFHQRRAELGLQWHPVPWGEVILAGGWAFDQRFDTGFDLRSTTNVRDISDQPFVRIGAQFAF